METSTEELTARIESLVQQAEALTDPVTRSLAIDLVSAVMDLHGGVLSRIVELAAASPVGRGLLETMSADDFIAAVLVLHDLHPDGLKTRVDRALDKLRSKLEVNGVEVALIEATTEAVRLRLTGGRPAARAIARHWIQSAVYEAAPEIQELIVEAPEEMTGFVPLSALLGAPEAV